MGVKAIQVFTLTVRGIHSPSLSAYLAPALAVLPSGLLAARALLLQLLLRLWIMVKREGVKSLKERQNHKNCERGWEGGREGGREGGTRMRR